MRSVADPEPDVMERFRMFWKVGFGSKPGQKSSGSATLVMTMNYPTILQIFVKFNYTAFVKI
jgi:hypothetical protein